MINFVALPLVATLVVALFGSRRLSQRRPKTAARCSAALLAAVAVATVPTLWLIGISGLAHMGFRNPIIDWSHHLLPDYPPIGAVVGAGSLLAAITGSIRAGRVLEHHGRVRCTDTEPVEYINTDEVYAYTLPGPARTIVVSDGLRDTLDDNEFMLVLAHEQAHARHRHDRFKLLALVTTAFVPPMVSVMRRLDFYLERWADEEALERTGAERPLAARTIAKVALSSPGPLPALGIADHGVAARAVALLEPIDHRRFSSRLQTSVIVAATLGLAAYQLHHTAMFAAELVR